MPTAHTFFLATLGCKVNQYESESLREAWLAQGCAEVADAALAEVVVINSCAVTAGAVADLRQLAARVQRANPAARIVVTGCAAQAVRSEVEAIPGLARIVPQSEKETLLAGLPLADLRSAAASAKAPARASATGSAAREFEISTGGQEEPIPPGEESEEGNMAGSRVSGRGRRPYPAFAVTASPRARAQVKVQDGCSHGCTYCIVPLARGRAVSREPAAVLDECRGLLRAGWRELVLSGINLRQYRADQRDFWDLLQLLERELAPEWAGRARLRLSSLDPGQLGSEALDTLAGSRLVCPHLHVSLQAGSPAVLHRMGRGHYRPADLAGFIDRLGGVWPRFGLGADLLTGFPGESPAEFEETRAFVAGLPLTYAHVFPFSPRPGTPAAAMPGPVEPEEKKRRAATLRRLAGAKRARFLASLADAPGGLTLVVEDAAAGRGTCEYGADCRLDPVPAGLAPRALLRVRFLDVDKNEVRVAPAANQT